MAGTSITQLYFKRFGKTRPDTVRSIEQMVKDKERKKAELIAIRAIRVLDNRLSAMARQPKPGRVGVGKHSR